MANSQGKASDWTNKDGLVIGYGPRVQANTRGGRLNTRGTVQEIKVDLTWDDLPAGGNGDVGEPAIPANAVILGGYVYVTTAFAATTALTIGLIQSDGTAIDADGLLTSKAAAALTDETKIALDGALVGTTIGTAIGQLVAAESDSTAGAATLVVEFVVPGR